MADTRQRNLLQRTHFDFPVWFKRHLNTRSRRALMLLLAIYIEVGIIASGSRGGVIALVGIIPVGVKLSRKREAMVTPVAQLAPRQSMGVTNPEGVASDRVRAAGHAR